MIGIMLTASYCHKRFYGLTEPVWVVNYLTDFLVWALILKLIMHWMKKKSSPSNVNNVNHSLNMISQMRLTGRIHIY